MFDCKGHEVGHLRQCCISLATLKSSFASDWPGGIRMEIDNDGRQKMDTILIELMEDDIDLPNDLTVSILQRLGAIYTLESAQKHVIRTRDNVQARHRSQLRDINIEYFASSTSPKDKKLSELAAKLPLLEELDMTISSLSEEPLKALKAFGRYCPLLKSLKWNQLWDGQPRICIEGDEEFDDDDEALAIAKNVPELHHLLLSGNRVTNDGLQAILDAGTNVGDISIWEVGRRERLVSRSFNVWDVGGCSMALQASLANDYTTSVNRVMWSPNGAPSGIAYSKHIVPRYPIMVVMICRTTWRSGLWNAVTSNKLYTFEGHKAPVYSMCPDNKENMQGSVGIVQFDTMKNRFLATGDEFQIKFLDKVDVNIFTTTALEGGLLASPCIRFNKEGILLTVSTRENGINILANADGL
nr:isoform 2 of topless-related protein 4 [Quercus suber]